jgi:hypothetical protein
LALAGLMALVLVAAGARLDRYRSVVIWRRRFTYAFGAAELAPAR